MKTTMSLAAISCLSLASSAHAALLSIDFGSTTYGSVTQTGFQAFTNDGSPSPSETRTFGAYDVTISGHDSGFIEGFYNRGGVTNGGSLTYADVYSDFVFKNGGAPQSMTVQLSGAGIAANTNYSLTFYSYDSFNFGGTPSTVDFIGSSGTLGSTSLVTPHDGTSPATNDAYAGTGLFTSNGSGVLTIDLTASGYSANVGIRLNGLELDAVTVAVPEPSTTALLGLGGLALAFRRRK